MTTRNMTLLIGVSIALLAVMACGGPSGSPPTVTPTPTQTATPTPTQTATPTPTQIATPIPTQEEFWARHVEMEQASFGQEDRFRACPQSRMRALGQSVVRAQMDFTAETNEQMLILLSRVQDAIDSTGFVMLEGLMAGEDYLFPEDVWAVVYPSYAEFLVFAEEAVRTTDKFLDKAGCPE